MIQTGNETQPLCVPEITDQCIEAVSIYNKTSIEGVSTEIIVLCPWNERTYNWSLISIAIFTGTYIPFLLLVRSKAYGVKCCGFLIGIVTVTGLLTTAILMLTEIIKGRSECEELWRGSEYSQATYIKNMLFILMLVGFMNYKDVLFLRTIKQYILVFSKVLKFC